MSDDRHLIRLALPDRPGGLALVTRCLASCGTDILAVEVVGHRDGQAIDDLLVQGGDLGRALAALEPEVELLGSAAPSTCPTPASRWPRRSAARSAPAIPERPATALLASLLAMVGADGGVLFARPTGSG